MEIVEMVEIVDWETIRGNIEDLTLKGMGVWWSGSVFISCFLSNRKTLFSSLSWINAIRII